MMAAILGVNHDAAVFRVSSGTIMKPILLHGVYVGLVQRRQVLGFARHADVKHGRTVACCRFDMHQSYRLRFPARRLDEAAKMVSKSTKATRWIG
jgi:hypothetical protein